LAKKDLSLPVRRDRRSSWISARLPLEHLAQAEAALTLR
jgi:hypothetical protein